MKRPLWVVGGIVLVLIGMALVMPAVAQMRDTGALQSVGVGLLLLGLALTGGGCWAVYGGVRRLLGASSRA